MIFLVIHPFHWNLRSPKLFRCTLPATNTLCTFSKIGWPAFLLLRDELKLAGKSSNIRIWSRLFEVLSTWAFGECEIEFQWNGSVTIFLSKPAWSWKFNEVNTFYPILAQTLVHQALFQQICSYYGCIQSHRPSVLKFWSVKIASKNNCSKSNNRKLNKNNL